MTPIVQNFNLVISVMVILGQIFCVFTIIAILVKQKQVLKFFNEYAAVLVSIIAGTAFFGSMFYSDYAMFNPCKLCWYQRIAIFPQFLIALIALITKDSKFVNYTLALSTIGLSIGSFQYLGQMGVTTLNCATVGQSLGCSERFVIEFGYITIPMMAMTTCAMIICVSLASKLYKR